MRHSVGWCKRHHPRMSSNFFRLYNELNKQTYDSLPKDISYNFERQELLYKLGHDVHFQEKRVTIERNMHHGKFVRKIRDSNPKSKWGTSEDCHPAMERRRVVQSTSKSGTELRKITREMEVEMKNEGKISDPMVRRLMMHDDRATLSLMKASIVSPVKIHNKKSAYYQDSEVLPPIAGHRCVKGEGYRQDVNSENKHVLVMQPNRIHKYTKQRWSQEERHALNDLFLELPQPTNKRNRELWNLYLQNLASRFVLTHPKRELEEVMEKVQLMITKKQFKEKGEVEQWDKLTGGDKS